MTTRAVAFLLLIATCAGEPFPLHELAVRDPKTFDLLYSTSSGPLNETWYFDTAVNLTAVILPTQVFNFGGSGPWPNGTYAEQIDVLVYETKLASGAANYETRLVGSGSFSGTVEFGREVSVPLRNSTENSTALTVQRYGNSSSGYRYILSLLFRTTGIYPWYTSRALTSYSTVNVASNAAGIALGIAFNP